jgi:hypothetical protein
MLLPRRFGRCLDEATCNLKKSNRVRHPIDHECGKRFGNIQLKVCPLLGGGINVQTLCLQSRNEATPVRVGNNSNRGTAGLEGSGDEVSKGV